jgi:predicted nucleotidyltransferase
MGTIEAMNRDNVIQTLRGHEAELRAAGVVRLSLFGSTARGDSRPDSDIDLLAVFDDTRRLSLLDVIHIQNQIADLLGAPVDLIEEGTLKPRVQKSVEAEVVRAF